MNGILQDDGTLLVPVGACIAAERTCIAAERISTDDPRHTELLAESVVAAQLDGTPQDDASLAVRWERNCQGRQPRSA